MTKIKIIDRLELLNNGRTHYLEFLRNLTPQIILLSLAIFLAGKISSVKIDWGGVLLMSILFGGFFVAFYGNCTLFYERCFSDWINWTKNIKGTILQDNIKGFSRISFILFSIWKNKFIETIEVIVCIISIVFILSSILFLASNSAISMWNKPISTKQTSTKKNVEEPPIKNIIPKNNNTSRTPKGP
ncbi:hypothetical protein AAKU55_004899 [Oxalobacteraceae bacterium GrIS 1.11]